MPCLPLTKEQQVSYDELLGTLHIYLVFSFVLLNKDDINNVNKQQAE